MHYACKRKPALDVYGKLSLLNITLCGAYMIAKYCCSVSSLTGEISSAAICSCQTAYQNSSVETVLALFTDTNYSSDNIPGDY